MPCCWSERSWWHWQLLPIARASSVWSEKVGTEQLYRSQSPLGLGGRSDEGSHTLCPNMAHCSFNGHVGYIVWTQIAGSRKILVCPLNVWYVYRWQFLKVFTCKKAKVLPISFATVPTLQQIGVGRNQEPWWCYRRGLVLWPQELS